MKRFLKWLGIKLGFCCPQCGQIARCNNHVGMCWDCWNYGVPEQSKHDPKQP